MRKLLLFFFGICAWAQSGIELPWIGAIVDASGTLRPVQGVAGSFLPGPATASGVLSVACSERLCLAKTDSAILSPTGESDAPPGPAIFSLDGDQALVYFPEPHLFSRWHGDTLDPLDWAVDGEILSVRVSGREAQIAVRRDGGVWIVHPDGSVADSLPDAAGPVLLVPDGVLFATAGELVLRHGDGTEVRFDFTGAESIAAMGRNYAAIRADGAIYALRTEPGRESLFLLPGNTP